MTELRAWDKRPDETSKSFKAFMTYLRLTDPTKPERSQRSLRRTADIMGYKSTTMVDTWSAKFDWVARAEAFDKHMGSQVIIYEEKGLQEFQTHVIKSLSEKLMMADAALERQILEITRAQEAGNPVDTLDIKRLYESIHISDNLKRRAARMPTTFIRETGNEPDDENLVFVIGGDAE